MAALVYVALRTPSSPLWRPGEAATIAAAEACACCGPTQCFFRARGSFFRGSYCFFTDVGCFP